MKKVIGLVLVAILLVLNLVPAVNFAGYAADIQNITAFAEEAEPGEIAELMASADFSGIIMNVGSDESQRNITWQSSLNLKGEVRYAPVSEKTIGEFPEKYSVAKAISVKATSGKYSYKATMTGLEENTTYAYCLVVGDGVSDIYTFDTKSYSDGFSFAFFSDAQVETSANSTAWKKAVKKFMGEFPDVSFMVSGGDQIALPTSESCYSYFIADEFKSVPVATTVGPSHDNAPPFKDHYNLPNLSSKSGVSLTSSDYFYKYNNALFMHINVESNDWNSHIEFIKNAIAVNPDCVWRIVVIHYSYFSPGKHNSEVSGSRSKFVDGISGLGIDVVLSGHDHAYSRSHLMLGSTTVAQNAPSGGSAVNPEGTIYLCGMSGSGATYYDGIYADYDEYVSVWQDDNRNGMVVFDVSDNSLSFNSYFMDADTPEKIDSFTINKISDPLRVNGRNDMLEFYDESAGEYIPIVGAYDYQSAIVRVQNNSWAISTDNGNSYKSLEIPSEEKGYVFRVNSESGYWEVSDNGGEAYMSTEIPSGRYTVKYVTDIEAQYGDSSDLSIYEARKFVTSVPDAPSLTLPVGSVAEGYKYDWAWKYYRLTDGEEVTEFENGSEYIAYLECIKTPVSDTLYVTNDGIGGEYTFTWSEAWNLVQTFFDEPITVALEEDITLSSADAVVVKYPINSTLDLCGHLLNTSAVATAFTFDSGATGASFDVITSAQNGTVKSGTKSLVKLNSNSASVVDINYGRKDTPPLTFESCGYLVNFSGGFKRNSTANINITNGSYAFSDGIVYITDVSDSVSKTNTYNVNASDAEFKFSGASASLAISRGSVYFAKANSKFVADGCKFVNAYNSASMPLLAQNCWLGTMSFTDCEFDEVYADSTVLGDITGFSFDEKCTFTDSVKAIEGSFEPDGEHMYRFDGGSDSWYKSNDGGATYEKLTFGDAPADFDCRVIADGVTTDYAAGTDFSTILKACDASSAKSISIVLNEDFNMSAVTMSTLTNYNMSIDLAGHTLKLNGVLKLSGSGFDVGIYSSVQGGKLSFASSGYIQPEVGGTISFGNAQYEKHIILESAGRIVNLGALKGGNLDVDYISATMTIANYGMLRINAMGKYTVTLDVDITDCDITGSSSAIFYNSSSTLSASGNGGVFDADSEIRIKNSSFTYKSTKPANFFGSANNFKDRYFGKIIVEDTTFTNYVINGGEIYSDSDVSYTYNTYPSNLPADYDPDRRIEIGKNCVFYNGDSTFNADFSGFSDANANMYLAENCTMEKEEDCVRVSYYDPDFDLPLEKTEILRRNAFDGNSIDSSISPESISGNASLSQGNGALTLYSPYTSGELGFKLAQPSELKGRFAMDFVIDTTSKSFRMKFADHIYVVHSELVYFGPGDLRITYYDEEGNSAVKTYDGSLSDKTKLTYLFDFDVTPARMSVWVNNELVLNDVRQKMPSGSYKDIKYVYMTHMTATFYGGWRDGKGTTNLYDYVAYRTPEFSGFKSTPLKISINGVEGNTALEPGKIAASSDATNYSSTPADVITVIGQYSKSDNKLLKVDFAKESVGRGAKTLLAEIETDSVDNTYVKAFMWDGNSLMPISSSEVIGN